MRRALVAALLLALTVPACASEGRPEGIVERWLLALNKGAAGEPDRYAPGAASERVLPRWEQRQPGELDVVEVARARHGPEGCDEGTWSVPFRVVRLEGSQLRSIADVEGSRVTHLTDRIGVTGPRFPSEGGPSFGTDRSIVWVIVIGVGLSLVLVGEGLMRLVRRHPS